VLGTLWLAAGNDWPNATREQLLDLAQMNATRAGLGVGGMQWGIARRDAALVPVLPDAVKFSLDMWLVMHADLRRHSPAQALFKHLAAELGAYAASCQAPA